MSVALAFGMIMVVSLASLLGVFLISLKENTLDKILFILVAFASGTILASALLDLIPESFHHLEELLEEGLDVEEHVVFMYILFGYIVFFILERFLYWFHGHAHEEKNEYVCHGDMQENMELSENNKPRIKRYAILNLIGDGLHNFLDGVIIMVAFLNSNVSGIAITLAVLVHELPQEIGDFGILMYGGFSKKNALLANFSSALIALFGGLFGYFMSDSVETFNLFFLAFSGGGFLYLACTELIPEMMKERNLKKSFIQSVIFGLGILMIYLLIEIVPHE